MASDCVVFFWLNMQQMLLHYAPNSRHQHPSLGIGKTPSLAYLLLITVIHTRLN